MTANASEARCVWPVQAALGEGPMWSAREQALWFTDIKSDTIHRFEPATGARQSWPTPPNPGFILPCGVDGFVVGLQSGLHDFRPDTASFTLRQPVECDVPGNRLNDGHVDAAGRLWFGTMDDGCREPTGSLYRYDSRGLHRADSGYAITNGPATSPDGRTLYHTDTRNGLIHAFDLSEDGHVTGKRIFATVDRGKPDGPIVDSEGCVWSALYGGWGLDRYAPSGELLRHYPLPVSNVTKAAFGGPDLKTLYVTSARQELDEAALKRQPLAGGLFAIDVDVEGLPQHHFAG